MYNFTNSVIKEIHEVPNVNKVLRFTLRFETQELSCGKNCLLTFAYKSDKNVYMNNEA